MNAISSKFQVKFETILTIVGVRSEVAPVKLWADFGSASYLPGERQGANRPCPAPLGDLFCGLSDKDAKFIAKTYSVISLEKCFGVRPGNSNQSNHTMANFATTAKQIMRLAPPNRKPQILFYWSSNIAVADCYEDNFGGAILQHKDWWLKNKTGGYMWQSIHSIGKRPYIDFTVAAAASWWVSIPIAAYNLSGGAMGGVFVDSAGDWADVLVARKQIGTQKAAALNTAHRTAIRKLRKQLHQTIGPDALLLGNALGPCLHPPCSADGIDLLRDNTLDGVCAEHFGAFEWLKNQSTGEVDPFVVRQWLDLFEAAANTQGSVFVKTWPGPVTSPIDEMGPSWPIDYLNPFTKQPLNRSNDGISAAAAQMLNYSLACYLCVWRPNFHFSYGWWYDVSQGYLPGSDSPLAWYPQFSKGIGKPISTANITGRNSGEMITCSRSFEGVDVFVDFLNFSSAKLIFKDAMAMTT